MKELFRRLIFNILIDNTDDHEKNHAFLIDDTQLFSLSPAFDVLPTGQAFGQQAMEVGSEGMYRASKMHYPWLLHMACLGKWHRTRQEILQKSFMVGKIIF